MYIKRHTPTFRYINHEQRPKTDPVSVLTFDESHIRQLARSRGGCASIVSYCIGARQFNLGLQQSVVTIAGIADIWLEMFSNWLTSTTTASSALQTNTPDVILEIGPLPFTRFAAHSTILAAHSGYLRSVLRPEERIPECPIYVPNVTSEHFTPLLTYMYTGFLDLNVENIFGVLLATHVLHMPRALEICRSFLARIQSEGYMSGGFFDKAPLQPQSGESVKVVRPIASKATNGGLAFIAPPVSKPLLGSHDTPFKSLSLTMSNSDSCEKHVEENKPDEESVRSESPTASTSQNVDVDRLSPEQELEIESKLVAKPAVKFRKRSHSQAQTSQTQTSVDVPDKEKDVGEPEKFIIDVASCDGPVRFQRVLNDAFGRFPVKSAANVAPKPVEHKRAHMANSFHLQMARNISERQAIEADRTDSENSEEIIVHNRSDKSAKGERTKCKNNCLASPKSEEVYNCVYCKHTFKSQYCYQKHAKRHINPLSVESGGGSKSGDKSEISSTKSAANSIATPSQSLQSDKREVRPLDMNVQYYPCKTCGSKFPSYYFVHKHRKLCHANEEN